jgi:nucleoside-diphosphate-sugar epimerase
MTILLTGSEGFIGSAIKRKLERAGYTVLCYDKKLGHDILDLVALEHHIQSSNYVIHVAAQANMYEMENIDGAYKGTDFNIRGTHNVAFLCAKHKIKLIYASTICAYGNIEQQATEDAKVNPSELYACTKYAGEVIVQGYALNFDLEYIILRFATTYGPGMRSVLGVHVFFTQALQDKDITIHGDGSQIRTLTYVDDIAAGCALAIKHFDNARNEIINLSQHEKVSAIKMAEDIKEITGSKSKIVFIDQRRNQIFNEHVCYEKAWKLLNWLPKYNWQQGLQHTYNWFKNGR